MSVLDQLAAEVAEDQQAIEGDQEDTRTRVKRMGKKLIRMQKEQKKEQKAAKVRGEDSQSWEEWCKEQKKKTPGEFFPSHQQATRYMLIAKYPGAYAKGMSIKEAYREAGRWKKNGGNPPPKLKVTIQKRSLITVQVMAGKLHKKLEALIDTDWEGLSTEEDWTEDELLGATDELTIVRQDCNAMLKYLKEFHESYDWPSKEEEVDA